MRKFDEQTIERWATMCQELLTRKNTGWLLANVTEGSMAWAIWTRAVNNVENVYSADRTITDAHIKTALQQIFINAEFKDKYRY